MAYKIKVRKQVNPIKLVAIFGTVGILTIIGIVLLWSKGFFIKGDIRPEGYEVIGVELNSETGYIDFQQLETQDVDFAFIKATEGSSTLDDKFTQNINASQGSDVAVGAYHFFSFDTEGITQASNFINRVSASSVDLPPMVMVDLYGQYREKPKKADEVIPELRILVDNLKQQYGRTCILWGTEETYNLYLKEQFQDCQFAIYKKDQAPTLAEEDKLTFWQYTTKGQIKESNGEIQVLSMYVFMGKKEDW